MPDEIQDFVYSNYAIRDSKKERRVSENLKQDYITHILQNSNELFLVSDIQWMFILCLQNFPLERGFLRERGKDNFQIQREKTLFPFFTLYI